MEAANAELARLAREDGLTGVANRRTLDLTLDEEWRRAHRLGTPLALILFDIDSFKAYNDRKGTRRATTPCAPWRRRWPRPTSARASWSPAMGARSSRSSCPGVPSRRRPGAAENLRERVQELALPHPGSTVAPVVTVSLGVAGADPATGGSPYDLVAAADRALYLAKQRGRNRAEMAPDREEPASRESSPAPSMK